MLQVKIAEVQREALKDLGVNLSGSLSVGQVNLGFNSTQTTLGNGVSGGLSLPNLQINAAIRALTERNSLRLLAEPTLTAMSGTPASFLAGGELPFTVADDSGRRTTEWKPFGVELDFTPTVRSNGLVGLKIRTSVSELRADGALNKREVGTDVELGLGQTLAIGGILQDTTRQQISGLPALGDIPILGALFRSREFRRNQTELVVLVTPYLARPGGQQALPTDDFVVAGDAAAIFLGHMEKMYGVGPAGMRGGYNGSVGFVLD
jgi:pilus assembly protein CpaC